MNRVRSYILPALLLGALPSTAIAADVPTYVVCDIEFYNNAQAALGGKKFVSERFTLLEDEHDPLFTPQAGGGRPFVMTQAYLDRLAAEGLRDSDVPGQVGGSHEGAHFWASDIVSKWRYTHEWEPLNSGCKQFIDTAGADAFIARRQQDGFVAGRFKDWFPDSPYFVRPAGLKAAAPAPKPAPKPPRAPLAGALIISDNTEGKDAKEAWDEQVRQGLAAQEQKRIETAARAMQEDAEMKVKIEAFFAERRRQGMAQ